MRNEDTKEIVEVIKNLESDLENTRNEIEVIRKIDTKAHIRQEQAPLINEIIKNNTNEIERLQVAHDNKEQEVKQAKIDFLTKVRELGEIKQRADELAKENTNSHEYARQENEPQKVFSSVKTNINELNKRGCIYISAEESEHHYTRKEPISAKLKRL
jgi:hypothetical protein